MTIRIALRAHSPYRARFKTYEVKISNPLELFATRGKKSSLLFNMVYDMG